MYNFDKVIDRHNTNSVRWSTIDKDAISLSVADMDFEVCKNIVEAIKKRADHKIFGYDELPDAWYDAYIDFWKRHHNFTIEKEDLIFSHGVVSSLASIIRKLTTPAEKIVVMTPTYHGFTKYAISTNGRYALENEIKFVDGEYFIDFSDLEEKLSDPQASMLVLCNPQNPIGRIWNKEELLKINALCKKHNVLVVSDEIHCDICTPGKEYVPFMSIGEDACENSIMLIAPTKTFNLAGIQTSAVVVKDKKIRQRVNRAINGDDHGEANTFAIVSTISAFTECDEWLKEMNEYVSNNRNYVTYYLKNNIPQLKNIYGETTYLLWIDCREVTNNIVEFCKYLEDEYKIYVSPGSQFGKGGEGFIRVNAAMPKSMLKEALERLKLAVENYKK